MIGKYQSNNWQWVKQKQCSGITDYSQVTVLSSYQASSAAGPSVLSNNEDEESELRNSKF